SCHARGGRGGGSDRDDATGSARGDASAGDLPAAGVESGDECGGVGGRGRAWAYPYACAAKMERGYELHDDGGGDEGAAGESRGDVLEAEEDVGAEVERKDRPGGQT